MVGHDIFKSPVPMETLYEFLDKFCIKNAKCKNKYYLLDATAFRKIQYHITWYNSFVQQIAPYYHTSKQMYLTRPLTYNNLVTIIRQICKMNDVIFFKRVSYSKDDYNNDYTITISPPLGNPSS
jgi:hypothetical protein